MIIGNPITLGGGGSNTIEVFVDAGAVVTAVHESGKTYTATSVDGVASIKVSDVGAYTVTADVNGATLIENIEVVDNFELHLYGVYGIKRDITLSSPEWVRTDGAVDFTATASVGTSAGASDFDSVYPWSGIERETLSTGDVMVRIPKFYFKRYRDGNIEYIKISGTQAEGFSLHPAFNHVGVEQDCIYVGAYKTSGSNRSVSGAKPQTGQTRATMRTNANAKQIGWGLIDISTLSAIQMLILVEFAHNNVQSVIGRGYVDGSSLITTGSCDAVPNLTGRPAGTDGQTDVVWRGIEGIWGNAWEFTDGINWESGELYVCNDPSKYADNTSANYTHLTYVGLLGAQSWIAQYIKEFGLDTTNAPHVMLPYVVGGSETTYYCDATWGNTGWRTCLSSGAYNSASLAGLFTLNFSETSSGTGVSMSSRLIYIPQ